MYEFSNDYEIIDLRWHLRVKDQGQTRKVKYLKNGTR